MSTVRRRSPIAARPPARLLLPAVFAPAVGSLPYFMAGALAVQLRHDLGLDPSSLGLLAASFPAGGALSSIAIGRVGDRLGPTRSLRGATAGGVITMLSIAVFAKDLGRLMALLALAGAVNAMAQSGASVYLTRVVDRGRLGLALGLKQVAAPVGTLLAGLAVPTLAVPFGWRWAYAVGAGLAALAMLTVPSVAATPRTATAARSTSSALAVLAFAAGLAAVGAAAIATFLVDAATRSGVSNSRAALVVVAGSLLGVLTRVGSGMRADRRRNDALKTVAAMQGIGAVMLLLLATQQPLALFIAGPLAYTTAWGWPGLLHLAVVRLHETRAGTATGYIETGMLVGTLAGPPVLGIVARDHSYPVVWLASSVCLAVAAAIVYAVDRATRPADAIEKS